MLGHFLVKMISAGGTFRLQNRLILIAQSLTSYHIGLERTDYRIWSILSNTALLAKFDERDYIIQGWHTSSVIHVAGLLCCSCPRLPNQSRNSRASCSRIALFDQFEAAVSVLTLTA